MPSFESRQCRPPINMHEYIVVRAYGATKSAQVRKVSMRQYQEGDLADSSCHVDWHPASARPCKLCVLLAFSLVRDHSSVYGPLISSNPMLIVLSVLCYSTNRSYRSIIIAAR